MTDVITDFTGAVIGIAIAIAAVALILIVWRLVSKKSFDNLIKTIKTINLKNVFKKNKDIVSLLDEKEEIICATNDENVAITDL